MGRYVSPREILWYMRGAIRLAVLDRDGMKHFANTPEACWRSFQAALLAAPLFYLYRSNAPPDVIAKIETLHGFLVEALIYAISWLLFPLVMFYVTDVFGRRDRYFAYIGAYNWASLLMVFLLFTTFLLGQTGIMEPAAIKSVTFVLNLAMLVYVGVIARIALQVTALTASGIVMLDFVISISVLTISNRLTGLA